MKKLFTLVCLAVCGISMMASSVTDLVTISSSHSIYFHELVSAKVPKDTLLDDGHLFSVNGNTYSSSKGSVNIGGKARLYCVRVKSHTQDVIAFKVGSPCTLVLYAERATDLTPFINDKVAAKTEGDKSISGVVTATDGKKGYVTYEIPAAGTYYIIGSGSDCYLAGLQFSGFCTPAEALVLTSDAAETVYVGDEITFSTTGGNGGDVTIAGEDEETISENKWTATVGEHSFFATQPKTGDYCSTESNELTITVLQATPVTSVTVAGETAAYVGTILKYTATAENATEYEWYLDGVKQEVNPNTSEFAYIAVKGEHSIVCKARNKFNAENEWIASVAKVVTVTNTYGQLIKATLGGGTSATVTTSPFTGTFDTNLSSGKYKLDKGVYAGIILTSGCFLEGDTVVITMTTAGNNYPCLFSDKERTNCLYLATETSSALEYKIVLPAAASGLISIYVARDSNDETYKWNPVLSSMSVIRPVDVKSTVETLTAVTINDVAISSSDLNKLVSGSSHTLILEDSYLNAPIVKFTKHTVITYEDESTKESDEVIEKTSTQAAAATWGASATIGNNSYTVYTQKTASYVVTYKLGTKTLGTENVAQNGSPANYATYQTLDNNGLSTFKDWYTDADLAEGHKVADISAVVITEATTFYAKFEFKYASSINIEQWILDNGAGKGASTKTTALLAEMGTRNYTSNIEWSNTDKEENELDSLTSAEGRNEPYLGLKVKKSGQLINFRLAPGSVVKVKFGATKTTPQVAINPINNEDYADMTITDGVYTYTATGEDLVSIYINVAQKAVVFKQFMIDEDIQTVVLPDIPSAIDNTADVVKATKRIEKGQLIIEKNGEVYNVLGARVR